MYCDVLNIGLFEIRKISSTGSAEEWEQYCLKVLEGNGLLDEEVTSKPMSYPQLARIR